MRGVWNTSERSFRSGTYFSAVFGQVRPRDVTWLGWGVPTNQKGSRGHVGSTSQSLRPANIFSRIFSDKRRKTFHQQPPYWLRRVSENRILFVVSLLFRQMCVCLMCVECKFRFLPVLVKVKSPGGLPWNAGTFGFGDCVSRTKMESWTVSWQLGALHYVPMLNFASSLYALEGVFSHRSWPPRERKTAENSPEKWNPGQTGRNERICCNYFRAIVNRIAMAEHLVDGPPNKRAKLGGDPFQNQSDASGNVFFAISFVKFRKWTVPTVISALPAILQIFVYFDPLRADPEVPIRYHLFYLIYKPEFSRKISSSPPFKTSFGRRISNEIPQFIKMWTCNLNTPPDNLSSFVVRWFLLINLPTLGIPFISLEFWQGFRWFPPNYYSWLFSPFCLLPMPVHAL